MLSGLCALTVEIHKLDACFQVQDTLFIIVQLAHLSPFSPLTCRQMVIKAPFIAFDNKSNRQFLSQAAQ